MIWVVEITSQKDAFGILGFMKITILSFGADWIPREWEQLANLFKPEIGDLHFPGINPGQATRDSANYKRHLGVPS